MAAFTKFHCFVADKHNGKHNLASDTLKVMFTNTAPVLTNAVKTDIAEITPAANYAAGGVTLSVTSSTQTTGTYKLILPDQSFTATGGAVGPFRYVVVYNDTSATDPLIGYVDYGGAITLADGEKIDFDFDQTNGLISGT